MKNIYIFLIFSTFSYSQNKIIVTDSISKEPLSYATIMFNGNDGLYSNEDGSFILNDNFKYVEVSYMGYKTKKIALTSLNDTIALQRSIKILDEVIITPRTQKKKINFLKSPNLFGNCILKPESEIINAIIPNKEIISMKIDKLSFSFQKLKWSKNKNILKDEMAVIRINIYSLKDNLPNKLLFKSNPMKINAYEKSLLEVSLEYETILIEENGLAVSIEYIGNINIKGELYKTSDLYLRPLLAENNNKFYSGNLYQKFQLKHDKNAMIDLVSHWNKTFAEKNKISPRILNISFELSK